MFDCEYVGYLSKIRDVVSGAFNIYVTGEIQYLKSNKSKKDNRQLATKIIIDLIELVKR